MIEPNQTASPAPTASLGRLMRALVAHVPASQQALDTLHEAQLARHADDLKHIGVPPHNPLAMAACPARVALVEQEIGVSLSLTVRHSVEVSAAARVGARVAHSFFHSRYGSATTRRDRLTLVVRSVPCACPPGAAAAATPAPAAQPPGE